MICTPYIEAQVKEWRRPDASPVDSEPATRCDAGPGSLETAQDLPEDADDDLVTDEALMTAVATIDDREAFAELFRRWHRRLRSYFWRRLRDDHLADDLASETFFLIFKSRATYRNVSTFERWLFRCGRNRLFNHWSGRRALPTAAEFAPAEVRSREPACDERMIAAETADVVQAVVCELPDREFDLVRRLYWDSERQVDVAGDEGVSRSRIGQVLEKAHDVIRNDSRVQYVLFGQRIELREVAAA